jgi:tRNA U34 5-carboxymethylaminomethyl modifying GTPase MnmE/TrmE
MFGNALNSIRESKHLLCTGQHWECVVSCLRSAHSSLGQVIGDDIPADVLDTIFSRFCIGK